MIELKVEVLADTGHPLRNSQCERDLAAKAKAKIILVHNTPYLPEIIPGEPVAEYREYARIRCSDGMIEWLSPCDHPEAKNIALDAAGKVLPTTVVGVIVKH